MVRYLEDNLKTVGLADAIRVPSEGGKTPNKKAVDVDGDDDVQGAEDKENPRPAEKEADGEKESKEKETTDKD